MQSSNVTGAGSDISSCHWWSGRALRSRNQRVSRRKKKTAGIFQAFSHIWLVVVGPYLYCPKRRMMGNLVSITTPAFIFLDLFFFYWNTNLTGST